MIARLAAVLLLAAPALAQEPCPFEGQPAKLVVQLFFGQSIRGQELISRAAWQRFVADTITPALPLGFTVVDGYGQYTDPVRGGIGREPTAVVTVAAEDSPAFRARIAGIVDAYRRRFAQRAVGVVSSVACGVF